MYWYVKLCNVGHFNKTSIIANAPIIKIRMGEYLKLNLINRIVLYKE